MSKYQNLKAKSGRFIGKLSVAVGGGMVAASSYAADHSAAITAAGTDGTTNTTAAVTALIGIVAVIVGVGFVISVLRKS